MDNLFDLKHIQEYRRLAELRRIALIEALIKRATLSEIWPSYGNQILSVGDLKTKYRFDPNILEDQITRLEDALTRKTKEGKTDTWNYRALVPDVAIPGGIPPLVPGLDR